MGRSESIVIAIEQFFAGDLADLSLIDLLPHWSAALWRVGMSDVFRHMLEADISLGESVLLHSLYRHGLTVADVALCLAVTQSAASRAVDRLVRAGFLSRQEDPDDRRQKRLTLTADGAKLAHAMDTAMATGVLRLVGTLTDEQREHLRRLLLAMIVAQDADGMPANAPVTTSV